MKVFSPTAMLIAVAIYAGAVHADRAAAATTDGDLVSMSRFSFLDQEPADQTPFQEETGLEGCESCCPDGGTGICPGWFFSVDYLNWKPRRRGLDFAIMDETPFVIGGDVESLELESDNGVRINVGWLFCSGWDASFTYTYYHSDDSRGVGVPGDDVWPTRIHPAFVNGGWTTPSRQITFAAAAATLDFDDFTLDAGYWLYPCDSISVRLFGGVRAATVDQKLSVAYFDALEESLALRHKVQMDGFGLRMGGETHWYLTENISVFGRAAASILIGDFHAQYSETESVIGGQQTVVNISDDYYQTVPVLETAAGVSWQRRLVTIQAGYELATWFNMGERINFTDSRQFGSMAITSNDLGLDGFFVRLIRGY